jgi:diguanylate cyclase (GGDEF)-like protein
MRMAASLDFSTVKSAKMDPEIKNYADTIYETGFHDSAETARNELKGHASSRALNAQNLPMSGVDIQRLTQIFNGHVERCMIYRFESYEDAYRESNRIPSDEDLDAILKEFQQVREFQVQHALKMLHTYVGTRGIAGAMPTALTIEAGSSHAHDRLVRRWKQWRARLQLMKATFIPPTTEKQRDVKFPVLNAAEFESDAEALSKAANPNCPLSLLVMDVDEFKAINDRLGGGHEGGDCALMAFSELLLRLAKSKGTAYRWGGDEFCVLLENHSLDEAYSVAERIRREVRELKIDRLPDGFSTSIGVATYPECTQNSSELFKLADRAMYESKEGGRNRVTRAARTSEINSGAGTKSSRPSAEEIKKQLAEFMREGKIIQNGVAYNNMASLQEKDGWENRVERYLSTSLDDSYAIQFQIPSREANDHPHGIVLAMLPAWREISSRLWMLSDFISKLRG